ncbi:MAG: sterol desaturase family protein [Bacteriovoracaceae bacterium]
MKITAASVHQIFSTQKYLQLVIVYSLLQLFFPYKQRNYPLQIFKGWYVSFMLSFAALAGCLVTAMIIFPLLGQWNLYGIVPYFKDLHPLIRFCILLFIYDTSVYWRHYVFHTVKILRKIHNVHHSDHYMDAMTSFRVHFLEIICSFIIVIVIFYPLGATVNEFILVYSIDQIIEVTSHADLRLPYKLEMILDKIFCTSGFHMHHHSSNTKEANENFGLIFNIWDRINKTYHKPEKDRRYEYGTRTDLEASNSLVKNFFLQLPYTNGAGLRAYKRGKK